MIAIVVDGLAPGMGIAVAFLAAKVRAAQAARGARHPWLTVSFVQPRRRAAAGPVGVFSIGGSVRRRDAGARRVSVNLERPGRRRASKIAREA